MTFRESTIDGAWLIEVEAAADERGLFARTFDADAFARLGVERPIVQCSTSFNARFATLRGMHYQESPHGEFKLVRCTAGRAYDVIVDLRPGSSSYLRWDAVELSSDKRNAVLVPPGVAHGFQTLADATEVLYMMDRAFEPAAARGVRWDDPAFAVEWPDAPGPRVMSDRDRGFPDYIVRQRA